MFTIPPLTYIHRLFVIIAGVTLLIWSGLEDNQVGGVVILGWTLALFSTILFVQSRFNGRILTPKTLLYVSPLVGAIIGSLASLITLLLMLFKDVRHAHIFPDYPPHMMIAILERLPIWSISGGLILFGLTLLLHLTGNDKGDTSPEDSVTM